MVAQSVVVLLYLVRSCRAQHRGALDDDFQAELDAAVSQKSCRLQQARATIFPRAYFLFARRMCMLERVSAHFVYWLYAMTIGTSTEAVLLHFSGADALGLTAELAGILARHNAEFLDIGQAVVHESLALGMLVRIGQQERGTLEAEVRERAVALGLQVRVTSVADDELAHWMSTFEQQHFIVTVLGRSITAEQLARVSNILVEHAMNIDRIERLSGQLTGESREPINACVQLSVRGMAERESSLRAACLVAAQELSIDIAVQRESIHRLNRRLFAFDMDSTLIQAEVIDELARLAGVGEQVAKITEAAMRGELLFDESFTRRVGLLKGLDAARVYELFETIKLTEGAERLIRTLKMLGYKVVILSGGFNFFARHLQERLGIDEFHANELEIVDGRVTGRVIPPIVNGARKAQLLAEIAEREGLSLEQCVAVGDGANDIPMLNLAGMGIAYRAKPVVRQKADQSISCLGLDGLLYLIGVRDRDL